MATRWAGSTARINRAPRPTPEIRPSSPAYSCGPTKGEPRQGIGLNPSDSTRASERTKFDFRPPLGGRTAAPDFPWSSTTADRPLPDAAVASGDLVTGEPGGAQRPALDETRP